MLKACSYCGRIHDGKHICPQKEQSIRARQSHRTEQSKQSRYFHNSKKWQDKREEIKLRDNYCCQVCVRGLHNPSRQYEIEDTSVHHIVPLAEDYEKRLDDGNLITLCSRHHEMAEKGQIKRAELFRITKEQDMEQSFPVCG